MKYEYFITTVKAAKPDEQIFVPNTDDITDVWRYLTDTLKDFPTYQDGSLKIIGIDEDAWCTKDVYLENYCPADSICIARSLTIPYT